jgi:hypothetical protein
MRVLNRSLTYPSRASFINLYFLTDLHIGARACDEAKLKADIQTIKDDPNGYWIGGGDYIDAIARKGDKRYLESTLAIWIHGRDDVIGQQVRYTAAALKPIAAKCLGLVDGNHERAALKYGDRDAYGDIVRYVASYGKQEPAALTLGTHGFMQLSISRKTGAKGSIANTWLLSIYLHHGFGGGRLPGGHALQMGRTMAEYRADLILMGHRHVSMVLPRTYTRVNGKGEVETGQQLGIWGPSYLRAYVQPSKGDDEHLLDTYSEEAGYSAQPTGMTLITLHPMERRMEARVSATAGVVLSGS